MWTVDGREGREGVGREGGGVRRGGKGNRRCEEDKGRREKVYRNRREEEMKREGLDRDCQRKRECGKEKRGVDFKKSGKCVRQEM